MKKIILLMAASLLIFSCGPSQEELLQKRVQGLAQMAELGTVEYTVKKIVKTEDSVWYKYGQRKILFTCTAFLKAGIDMKNFSADKVSVNKEKNSISIVLPKATILSFNMPPEEIKQVYTRVTGLRDDFTPEEKQELLVLGEKDIIEDIPNMGILADAEANAKLFFNALFSQLGYKTITINFE